MTETSAPHTEPDAPADDTDTRAAAPTGDPADGDEGAAPRATAAHQADTDAEDEGDEDEDGDDAEDEGDDDGEDKAEDGDAEGGRRGPSDTELFAQSEIAADYIEGLLDILDMDGDIDELVSSGRPVVEVVGGRLQNLVGQRGATLEALQELTRLAVYRQTGAPSRLLLDVGGFRAGRRKELAGVARTAVEKVRESGEALRLEPMSAFERKCVHDVVNAADGVQSESEGVEPNRRIVVHPA
ncbi:Jag family protein [Pilimelia terevasa]|uniref:Jag family protein n=1 Tax=Pilimelia terevasa TaxID=53372 RepID=UPI0016663D32|nr:R3H domain-containing nucleic acid-binding protein [Pilimelia terevasa]